MSYKGTTYKHKKETKEKIRKALLGNKPWNKGKKYTAIEGEKHPLWKGEKASYAAIHMWIARKLGKPSKCEHCETTESKRFEWANISGEYKRELSDWRRLCIKCHHKLDNIANRGWVTRRTKNG